MVNKNYNNFLFYLFTCIISDQFFNLQHQELYCFTLKYFTIFMTMNKKLIELLGFKLIKS